ncbi:hypothetical protein OPAG_04106 [Rhodococcus opacus PD630]|nr:hypothetical protein Pd630_LPD03811 [Rhodococcus opacus PD630]EHI47303.1 hypothetical protein OPAG_04106 [Rhodococcus opacus PD630]
MEPGVDDRPIAVEERVVTKPARTRAAAAFALAVGVAAFVCADRDPVPGRVGPGHHRVDPRCAGGPPGGITGKGVAIAGLVLSALAIVISIAFAPAWSPS